MKNELKTPMIILALGLVQIPAQAVSKKDEYLRPIHVPRLFLFGSQDDNKKEILNMEKIRPGFASCVETEGVGHGDAFFKPQFRPAVQKLFAGKTARPGGQP